MKYPKSPHRTSGSEAHGSEETACKILLVEDSEDNTYLISRILSLQGHAVTCASNGLEALEAMRGKRFDLILMDIQMPVMDGIEATQHIREHGFTQPIIACTAMIGEYEKNILKGTGFTDVFVKPLNFSKLLAKIDLLTFRSR